MLNVSVIFSTFWQLVEGDTFEAKFAGTVM